MHSCYFAVFLIKVSQIQRSRKKKRSIIILMFAPLRIIFIGTNRCDANFASNEMLKYVNLTSYLNFSINHCMTIFTDTSNSQQNRIEKIFLVKKVFGKSFYVKNAKAISVVLRTMLAGYFMVARKQISPSIKVK